MVTKFTKNFRQGLISSTTTQLLSLLHYEQPFLSSLLTSQVTTHFPTAPHHGVSAGAMIEGLFSYVGNVQLKAVHVIVVVGSHKEYLFSISRQLHKHLKEHKHPSEKLLITALIQNYSETCL